MEAAVASHNSTDIAEQEKAEAMFFDAEKFFAEARCRMEIRLQKIRGEETSGESKIFVHANDYTRS